MYCDVDARMGAVGCQQSQCGSRASSQLRRGDSVINAQLASHAKAPVYS